MKIEVDDIGFTALEYTTYLEVYTANVPTLRARLALLERPPDKLHLEERGAMTQAQAVFGTGTPISLYLKAVRLLSKLERQLGDGKKTKYVCVQRRHQLGGSSEVLVKDRDGMVHLIEKDRAAQRTSRDEQGISYHVATMQEAVRLGADLTVSNEWVIDGTEYVIRVGA